MPFSNAYKQLLVYALACGAAMVSSAAEMIKANGELDRGSYIIANVFSARSIDYYTLKGGGPESYKPEFTSHGFRYFEISAPTTTIETNVVVKAIGNSMPLQAHFDSSSKVLNEIYQGYVWVQRDNSIFFPMGCNNRAERHPWVLDAQVTEQAAMLYFGAQGFYEKWLNDFLDGEMANGFMAVVVPNQRGGTDPIWAAAAATLAWDHFASYGDTAVAGHYYPSP
ncbi:MAG: family 78 glycoside hydrolase catalytic domain [Verrucomicrobiota bacterium]